MRERTGIATNLFRRMIPRQRISTSKCWGGCRALPSRKESIIEPKNVCGSMPLLKTEGEFWVDCLSINRLGKSKVCFRLFVTEVLQMQFMLRWRWASLLNANRQSVGHIALKNFFFKGNLDQKQLKVKILYGNCSIKKKKENVTEKIPNKSHADPNSSEMLYVSRYTSHLCKVLSKKKVQNFWLNSIDKFS